LSADHAAAQPHPIWLARHLPSAQASTDPISGPGFSTWSTEYDAVGLADGAAPNRELIELARRCTVLCSPLPRAVETARLAGAEPVITPILARAVRPDVPITFVRLRPKMWRAVTRVVWQFGWAPAIETQPQARARAAEAATQLATVALQGEVLVIGHNYFNSLIGAALRRQGWSGPRMPTTRHGRASVYVPRARRTAPWRASHALSPGNAPR
jgi:broad specificity phosphatase PhoE